MADQTTHESKRTPLLHRIRLKVFALLVGITLAVIGAVSWAALPIWPVIGVAVATVAFVVNSLTSRLSEPLCWTCGEDLSRQAAGEYGLMCPSCGSLNVGFEQAAADPNEPPAGT